MNIKIDTSEVTNWINNQPNRERAKGVLLNGIGNKLQREVQTEASKISTTNTLKNSVSYKVENNQKVNLWAVGYGMAALETGRKPGRMPPPQALERWASLKLGNRAAAFQVARKIASSGTQKFQQKGPKQLTDVENRIIRLLSVDFDKFLNEYTK